MVHIHMLENTYSAKYTLVLHRGQAGPRPQGGACPPARGYDIRDVCNMLTALVALEIISSLTSAMDECSFKALVALVNCQPNECK